MRLSVKTKVAAVANKLANTDAATALFVRGLRRAAVDKFVHNRRDPTILIFFAASGDSDAAARAGCRD